MKSKINPVIIIMGLFVFKVAVIDNFRFKETNSAADYRVANVDSSSKRVTR